MATHETSTAPTTSSPASQQNHTTPAIKDFFHAIKRNDLDAVKKHIEEKGEKVTKLTTGKKTGAIVAAELGHLPILKYFLEKNATLLAVTDIMGNTVLQNAIQNGDLEMVKYLVEERKADILAIDHHINTAVHVAALEGQLEILKYFIEEKQADVNILNLNGEPPIFVAAEKPYMYVIMYLLEERKADVTLKDLAEDTILFKSGKFHDLNVPKYLLDTKKIEFDVNWKNFLGYTPVNWASRFNSTEFVKYMVEQKKADINIPDTRMVRTPLHQAALTNNAALCEFLVKHGAKVDAKDKNGNTPANLTTCDEVLKCLSASTANRKRRSVAEAMTIPRQSGAIALSFNYKYERILSGNQDVATVQRDIPVHAVNVLDSLLGAADTAVKYFRGSPAYQRVELPSVQSPQEYLRGKMDPVAIDAVDNLPAFEE